MGDDLPHAHHDSGRVRHRRHEQEEGARRGAVGHPRRGRRVLRRGSADGARLLCQRRGPQPDERLLRRVPRLRHAVLPRRVQDRL